MEKNYATHHAGVTVDAPVHEVYSLFTHFNDFPKFMHFVKEVTYHDDQSSHWVADVVGHHEWDAINSNWVPDQEIGWRSTKGLENFGKVTFEPEGTNRTRVNVFINYNPPGGIFGDIGEKLGAGSRFEKDLQNDLTNFAQMVDNAPPGALDPTSSSYLFHEESAATRGQTTKRQNETMANDPNLAQKPGSSDRPVLDQDITGTSNQRLAHKDSDIGTTPVEPHETIAPPPPHQERDQLGY